jgi:hypothetical protein
MIVVEKEELVERLAGEAEVLGENLPQCGFVYNKPHFSICCTDANPGCRGWKPTSNRFSYGTALEA